MAYDKDQTEPSLPADSSGKRESANLLPKFYRTSSNKKFLQATVDQLIQPGTVKKINGYIGRKNSKAASSKDIFISAADTQRQHYQLEPSTVVKDDLDNVTYFKDYIDYINQIDIFDGNTSNHSRLNQQEFYSWNPHICWDKFVNFQQYYWLPFGPDVINVSGQQEEIISTYTVKTVDEVDNVAYLFTPNGLTRNPTLTLFRGQTYTFEIDAINHPFVLKTVRSEGFIDAYNKGVTNNRIEQGELIFEVPDDAPDVLFYVSANDIDTGGVIKILDIEENTFINIEDEILGKKSYTIPNITEELLSLSNGMKVNFIGRVEPEIYKQGYWYVEGVGDAIKLVSERDLEVRSTYIQQSQVFFDDVPFDQLPFSEIGFYPLRKDYITINRASPDNNPWSRYNRWFHQDVIIASANANKKPPSLDQKQRATRPIIEFNSGLKLFNFGTASKKYVDVIDTFTNDVFSTIEGSRGYNVDGIDLADGMRVLFTADTDSLVRNKVYKVNFININLPARQLDFDADRNINLDTSVITFTTEHGLTTGNRVFYLQNGNVVIPGLINRGIYYVKVISPFAIELYSDEKLEVQRTIFGLSFGIHKLEIFSGRRRQIHLTEEPDTDPVFEQTVAVKFGTNDKLAEGIIGNQGQNYWFDGDTWRLAQIKFDVNQEPLFDLFDEQGISFTDPIKYEGSSFTGNKVFSYCRCRGVVDKELGFAISYRNINNVGDIVFDFNLLNEEFAYKQRTDVLFKKTNVGFLKIVTDIDRFSYENGWKKSIVDDTQPVVRIFNGSEFTNNFPIDVFDDKDNLEDLSVKVYVNGKRIFKELFSLEETAIFKVVKLNTPVLENDIVTLKLYAQQKKNNNGYYEFPINLQNNPLNEDINSFTLGQVIDHVDSIVDYLPDFKGIYPGNNNLRDLGNVSDRGTRFVQHSAPINLSLYHLTDKEANIINALTKACDDYAKFKRSFLLAATQSDFDGTDKDHVDYLLQNLNRNKPKTLPYYLSDMFAYQAAERLDYVVLDERIKKYPLVEKFNLKTLSNTAVSIYLNGECLIHGRDYVFGDDEFFEVLTDIKENDQITAFQYSSTDGCYCAPTPTKLGIYPKYEPIKYVDTTYKPRIFTFNVKETSNIEFFIDSVDDLISDAEIKVYVDGIEKDVDVDYVILKTVNSTYVRFKSALLQTAQVVVKVPVVVVRGHDGSITVAFNDYRDNLILELEKRIYNNIKVEYDTDVFDILDYLPGYSRNTSYSRKEFELILSRSFYKWLQLVNEDFTKNGFFDNDDEFTFNHFGKYSPNGFDIPAFWRGIYNWYFDTDKPHLTPWETLGFSVKPSWWEEVYGPAPYTSDNLVLWEDIKTGTIREPGKIVLRNPKVARTILENGVPVDNQGNLLPPVLTNLIEGVLLDTSKNNYNFGDYAVVENAWRKSSNYAFALIKTLILMSPADVIARTLDRSRIVKNLSAQLVYKDTNLRISLKDIKLPSIAFISSDRVYTSGLVNYIVDFITSENAKKVNRYKFNLSNLTNAVSSRIGAFTSKEKMRILLDSKSPSSSGGVFVPEENYRIELNTSNPIKKVSYSGVIITKIETGFEVKGYDYNNQFFVVYPHRLTDKTINVGGISESFANWTPGQFYSAGKVVKANEKYFRVRVAHTSGESLDPSIYTQLPDLPLVGGRTAVLRKDWDFENPKDVAYNTILSSIQDVVDFLQGYGVYLEKQGFVFDDFNTSVGSISNWESSIKEFLFWTTQNWTDGAVLSLSPAANKLVYKSNISVVDNITDLFYEYNIFKVDGKKIEPEFLSVYRSENIFSLEPSDTEAGIYGAVLHLVQKEHVLLLDDTTLFNDIIYDKPAGYRQERLKVIGYVTSSWTGSFETPGFIYDQRNISLWEPWSDYNLGDVIKHKEFYYAAKKFTPGEFEFDPEKWYLLAAEPKSQLLANWDYRAEQFTDFYDLDTDNFDIEQQKIAQHLIGYQKRQYLENIINNDVSQYKFYQGMIAEKGTQNVFNKLFDVLSGSETESLSFDEEWAVRVGEYGAIDSFNEVEFIIDEKNVKVNPQPIELVDEIDATVTDFVYRQRPSDVYIKPDTYSNNLFPELRKPRYLRTLGYIRNQDVLTTVDNIDELLSVESLNFKEGDYIHTAFEPKGWGVYRITKANFRVIELDNDSSNAVLTCNRLVDLTAGAIITMLGVGNTNKFYKIASVINEKITIEGKLPSKDFSLNNVIFYMLSSKIDNINNLNNYLNFEIKKDETVWSEDDGNGIPAAFKNTKLYQKSKIVNVNPAENLRFGLSVAISGDGNTIAIATENEITIYDKGSANLPWRSSNRYYKNLPAPKFRSFGSVLSFSKDSEWFIISAPENAAASSIFEGVTTVYGENEGFFNLYRKTPSGRYFFVREFRAPVPTVNEKFGSKFAINEVLGGYLMAVYSSGTDKLRIYKYQIGNPRTQWDLIKTIDAGQEFADDFSLSSDGTLVISDPGANQGSGKVHIYKYENNDIVFDYELERLEQAEIFKISRLNGVVRVTTTKGHNFSSGYTVTIASQDDPSFDITDKEITVIDDTTFSYRLPLNVETLKSKEIIAPVNTTMTVDDGDFERFGHTVALSQTGKYLAVGASRADVNGKIDVGAVSLFKKVNGVFEKYQIINSRREEQLELFGSDLEFMNDDQTLVIYSKYSDREEVTTFDNAATLFDKTSTNFKDVVEDTSRVDVYDRLSSKFVYSETLMHKSFPRDNYGSQLAVGSNVVVVGAIGKSDEGFKNSGVVYSYVKPARQLGWQKIYQQEPNVDAGKIKKVFLYNRKTNNIVTYLDVVDVNQGKIAGVAEQEIKFKTYYDPAIYSSILTANMLEEGITYEIKTVGSTNWNAVAGTDNILYKAGDLVTAVSSGTGSGTAIVNGTNVDEGLAWTNKNVGMLWWDLTKSKFVENNIGDAVYKSANWNKLYDTASIDIYEWVESKLTPAEWLKIADTESGLTKGISGTPKYGKGVFSTRTFYDKVAQKFKNLYYFWVKNKQTVPFVEGRSLSANDVATLIADPVGYGYPCLAVNSSDTISLVNCARFLEDDNVVLNIQFWITDEPTNYHSEWKLISLNETTVIPTYIEQKWFHSLIGKDDQDRIVPDITIPVKNRYGVEFRPRQGMFVNRIEALKQFVEQTNIVLKNILVADTFDLSKINSFDPTPSKISGEWDVEIDTERELRFVSTVRFRMPSFTANIEDGKIIGIEILNGGEGYGRLVPVDTLELEPTKWYGPDLIILGQGKNAKIKTIVNFDGTIVDTVIVDSGKGYTIDTTVTIRPLSVLVISDSGSLDAWSIYNWNSINWTRVKTQSFDARRYWKYIDWYSNDVDQFTKIDYVFENTYQLITQDIPVRSIIKVTNVGSGGWSLFRKINDVKTIDYTENFEVVGRQNGSIQLLDSLYNPTQAYDSVLLDSALYDSYAVQELRLILDTLKNSILADEYKVEYLKLFFNSVKYVMHEQLFVDWIFKSSFVKAMHQVGDLKQKTNYNSDNLEFFEEYIKEVKPYATKVREYISEYTTTDPTKTAVMDFDLLPVIDESFKVFPLDVKVIDNEIVSSRIELDQQPWKNWADNLGFEITDIEIIDQGNGYLASPKIEITGDQLPGGKPAEAKAYISGGKVNRIKLLSPGTKWINNPTISIKGGEGLTTVPAKAVAVIGNSIVRSNLLKIKFDRLNKVYQVSTLNVSETFETLAPQSSFVLKWSPDTKFNSYNVIVNGSEVLKNEYVISTETKVVNGQTMYYGVLSFKTQLAADSSVLINYNKNFNHLSATDRINFYYDPKTGQLGKDLGLLMTGVDYGGVTITGTDFAVNFGWDTLPWFVDTWDSMDPEFDDYIITVSNSTTRKFKLPYVPEKNELITVYVSKIDDNPNSETYKKYKPAVRIDDENYLTINQKNVTAIMTTFVGDGEIDVITLPDSLDLSVVTIPENDIIQEFGDRVIFRKITSDGSISNRTEDYDTKLSGGNLAYSTATGFAPDDIILDGDDFITPMTSHAPEEVLPGHVMDALAIKVYSRPGSGAPNFVFKSYLGTGTEVGFEIGQFFPSNNSVIVKINDNFLRLDFDYTIDYRNNLVVFSNPPALNDVISIVSISFNSANLLDLDYFIADGETTEFITKAPWLPNVNVTVLVDGQVPDYEIFSTDSTYTNLENQTWRARVGVKFADAPAEGALVNYIIDTLDITQTSSIVRSQSFISTTGVLEYNLIHPIGVNQPFDANAIVRVGNKILAPASYEYFKLTDNRLRFELKDSKYQFAIPSTNDIVVYIGNSKLRIGIDYNVEFEMSTPLYGIDRNTFTLSRGTGYSVNDVLTAQGGTIFSAETKIRVSAVSPNGQILSFDVINLGKYLTPPTGVVTLSGGSGQDASFTADYVVVQDFAASTIVLRSRVYKEGETLIIGVSTYADYKIENNKVIFNNLPGGSLVEITSFFNHKILGIERTVDRFDQVVELAPGTTEYYEYSGKLGGIYQLNKPVVSGNFVWVIKNRDLLTNNKDYYLETDLQTLRITQPISTEDVLQIIAFTNTPVTDSFGYMQFKDVMNRVHYKRLNAEKSTKLINPLLQFDKEILVEDPSALDDPRPLENIPGIIEIKGERIEYFAKQGNVLSQLRRATLGTGSPIIHESGTLVQNIGSSETIPYKDKYLVETYTSDGVSNSITLPYNFDADTFRFNQSSKDLIEVFVQGYRLKKNEYALYSDAEYAYSPEGDELLPPEFVLKQTEENHTILELATTPPMGAKIVVIKRQGQLWNDTGKRLANSKTLVAEFLTAARTVWPIA